MMEKILIVSELKLENLTWDELEGHAIVAGYSFINVTDYMKRQTEKELRQRLTPDDDKYKECNDMDNDKDDIVISDDKDIDDIVISDDSDGIIVGDSDDSDKSHSKYD